MCFPPHQYPNRTKFPPSPASSFPLLFSPLLHSLSPPPPPTTTTARATAVTASFTARSPPLSDLTSSSSPPFPLQLYSFPPKRNPKPSLSILQTLSSTQTARKICHQFSTNCDF
ncbi:hypothetical protein Dimus_020029 [Dionaea muscipula]